MNFFDAHNHLQDAWLAPHRAQIFRDLETIPLGGAVVNGTCETDWPEVAALAREHRFIIPSFGLHPWNVGNASPQWRDALVREFDTNPRAALGEIGLDRWILDRARPDDSRLAGLRRASLDEQLDAFHWQLQLAAERNVAVTIHCLDAWGAVLDALRTGARSECGFLLHAYGGSSELAREFAALGGYFSFNGYFLGERQQAKREVFKVIPAERLLAETDAPAMPLPAALRTHELPGLADGNPINHPANIGAVYAGLAKLRGTSLEDIAAQLELNFARLFGKGPA
jgi:TatD DNase family protein